MATTTKTLTPTNQTITLPDMTERPNASVLVDGIGKDADAINALSEQIANDDIIAPTAGTNVTIDAGGYCVVGKMVFVNIRLTTSATISSGYLVTNLPHPKPSNNKNYVPVYGYGVGNQIFITSNGEMQVNESIGAGMIMVSATYMI